MSAIISEQKRKELLEKRKYYSEHPQEARKDALKRKDDYVPVGKDGKKK